VTVSSASPVRSAHCRAAASAYSVSQLVGHPQPGPPTPSAFKPGQDTTHSLWKPLRRSGRARLGPRLPHRQLHSARVVGRAPAQREQSTGRCTECGMGIDTSACISTLDEHCIQAANSRALASQAPPRHTQARTRLLPQRLLWQELCVLSVHLCLLLLRWHASFWPCHRSVQLLKL
jgi:hypothetical protein